MQGLLMGLFRTFAALAAITVAAFDPDAALGAEAGAVTFAAGDGVAVLDSASDGGNGIDRPPTGGTH